MTIEDILRNNQLCIVDIGASGSIHPRWTKYNSNGLMAVLFEPDQREFEKLKSVSPDNYIVSNSALSDFSGEMDFNLCKKQEASSVYLPNFGFLEKFPDSDRFEVLKTIKIITDTLDNQLRKNRILDIDFIKIDAQGHELPILRGAASVLTNVIGLELEVEFVQIYKNQPLFTEVNDFVTNSGFELYDIKRFFWQRKDAYNYRNNEKGQLIFGDALYFRSPEDVCSASNITEGKVLRAVITYLAYGYSDVAKSLCSLAREKGILSSRVYKKAERVIARGQSRIVLPEFKGKGKINNALVRFAGIFSSSNWCSCDDLLGSS